MGYRAEDDAIMEALFRKGFSPLTFEKDADSFAYYLLPPAHRHKQAFTPDGLVRANFVRINRQDSVTVRMDDPVVDLFVYGPIQYFLVTACGEIRYLLQGGEGSNRVRPAFLSRLFTAAPALHSSIDELIAAGPSSIPAGLS
jgi:hypothetical protein